MCDQHFNPINSFSLLRIVSSIFQIILFIQYFVSVFWFGLVWFGWGRLLGTPPTISWDEFKQLAASCNIREEASLKRATRFLHETGSLIYFEVIFYHPSFLSQ
jgi:hypothetical protein